MGNVVLGEQLVENGHQLRAYLSREGEVRPLNSSSRLDAVAGDLANKSLLHCYACYSSM